MKLRVFDAYPWPHTNTYVPYPSVFCLPHNLQSCFLLFFTPFRSVFRAGSKIVVDMSQASGKTIIHIICGQKIDRLSDKANVEHEDSQNHHQDIDRALKQRNERRQLGQRKNAHAAQDTEPIIQILIVRHQIQNRHPNAYAVVVQQNKNRRHIIIQSRNRIFAANSHLGQSVHNLEIACNAILASPPHEHK